MNSAHAVCAGSSTAAQVAGKPVEQSSAGSSQHSVLTGANTAANSSVLLQDATSTDLDGTCPFDGSVGGAGGPAGAGTNAPSVAHAATPSSLMHPMITTKQAGLVLQVELEAHVRHSIELQTGVIHDGQFPRAVRRVVDPAIVHQSWTEVRRCWHCTRIRWVARSRRVLFAVATLLCLPVALLW
jgi:hypothetical protein